jgi:probable rRNA maturation factor
MSSRRKRSQQLDVTVQFATRRTGVPHATSLSKWANLAFDASQARKPAAMPLTIRIVGAAESRVLNRTWRGKDKPTNVLSFPADSSVDMPAAVHAEEQLPLGDLAICAPVVAREAREQGKDPRAHWAHMVVHGVLHLLGYDHENDRDADVMESREVKILAEFGYANPYA